MKLYNTKSTQSGLYGLHFTPSLCLHLITDSSHIVPIIYRLTTCLFTMSNSTCHRHNDQLNSCMWAAHTHHSWHLKSSGIHWCFSKLWNSAELSSGLFKYSSNVYFDDWREWQDEAFCHPNVDTHTHTLKLTRCGNARLMTSTDCQPCLLLLLPVPQLATQRSDNNRVLGIVKWSLQLEVTWDVCVYVKMYPWNTDTRCTWGNYVRCWLLESIELLQ